MTRPQLAADMLEFGATVRVVGQGESSTWLGSVERRSVELIAVSVTWSVYSDYLGRDLRLGAVVIQMGQWWAVRRRRRSRL